MKYETPSASTIKELAGEMGFTVDDATAEEMRTFWAPFTDAFNHVEETPDDLPPVKYERGAWSRPDRSENPHGGWYVKARIEGAADGPLKGRTVAIKDSACVAGIPMMNGASVLEGYVPDIDATVVTRLLDAGATILGKSVCEYFCVSGGSNTSASDIAESPRNPGHTPGGSSTGSAALVASGEVDMALGGDQAGSIRIPASMSGIVGIKPTFGLIPYTGIMGIETTVDHTGPMTENVADNALFLESMAGEDGLDPRQRVPKVDSYTDALGGDVRGMRIAVVSEGFGRYDSLPDVDATVRAAARQLESLGAQVTEVSIPMHMTGLAIWGGICADGMYYTMFRGYGFGKNIGGVYPTSLIDEMARAASRAEEFPHTFRFGLLLGRYTDKAYGGHFHAKAQNQRRLLRAAYDAVLAENDLLLMPTAAMTTSKIPPRDAPFLETMGHCWEAIGNTAPFNVSHHPAISIPCGMGAGDKPVGLMLVGRHFEETTLYRAAHAYEQSCDWQTQGEKG